PRSDKWKEQPLLTCPSEEKGAHAQHQPETSANQPGDDPEGRNDAEDQRDAAKSDCGDAKPELQAAAAGGGRARRRVSDRDRLDENRSGEFSRRRGRGWRHGLDGHDFFDGRHSEGRAALGAADLATGGVVRRVQPGVAVWTGNGNRHDDLWRASFWKSARM